LATTHHDATGFDTTTHRVDSTPTRVVSQVGDETKPSFKTTELIVMAAAVAGVLVASTMDDSLNTLWAWILVSALAIGYMLSRGLAKSGSQHRDRT
jgi:hypothetical protein